MKIHGLSISLVLVLSLLAVFLVGGCLNSSPPGFKIRSSAFEYGARIPAEYTTDGTEASPPLSWDNAPAGTQSFALILDDPDAPLAGGFTHWVVYNIPSSVASLPENIPTTSVNISGGGVQGVNGTGNPGYIGPAPPANSGIHLYRFNLYALNTILNLAPGATKDELTAAMGTHIIGNALLTGTYSNP